LTTRQINCFRSVRQASQLLPSQPRVHHRTVWRLSTKTGVKLYKIHTIIWYVYMYLVLHMSMYFYCRIALTISYIMLWHDYIRSRKDTCLDLERVSESYQIFTRTRQVLTAGSVQSVPTALTGACVPSFPLVDYNDFSRFFYFSYAFNPACSHPTIAQARYDRTSVILRDRGILE
jgi:hypothetical protein